MKGNTMKMGAKGISRTFIVIAISLMFLGGIVGCTTVNATSPKVVSVTKPYSQSKYDKPTEADKVKNIWSEIDEYLFSGDVSTGKKTLETIMEIAKKYGYTNETASAQFKPIQQLGFVQIIVFLKGETQERPVYILYFFLSFQRIQESVEKNSTEGPKYNI